MKQLSDPSNGQLLSLWSVFYEIKVIELQFMLVEISEEQGQGSTLMPCCHKYLYSNVSIESLTKKLLNSRRKLFINKFWKKKMPTISPAK